MFIKVHRLKCHAVCYLKYFSKLKIDEANIGKQQQLLKKVIFIKPFSVLFCIF